ncbi:FlgO family outer membrane protein [Gemmatimonas sp.]|uniref:FlgO family outer membrane protein n=1 Tax=Gemmatimonas sp. TaxID=1962908 RepID=UPI00286E053F|nr:FlgO family outer membrane protein [Gemmatimonas sp.]
MTDLRAQLQATLGPGYTLERELGGGGMSRVFVARENALGRDVVVKVLAPELSAGVSAERFTREIATAARLQQANIVPVLAAGTAGGVPYYTMPFVTGESLRALMANGTPCSPADALNVLRDVARALAYAHGQSVIHRDIKPDNILLSAGTAVVTDFGIAKAISASRTMEGAAPASKDGTLTQVGSSIGTPAYMAPEQAVGDTIDHRADLYAWGVVAYELLSGTHPFAGKTGSAQWVAAHVAEVPRDLREHMPGIAPDLAAIVMQCLAKNPADRPASATALLTRLGSITLGAIHASTIHAGAISESRAATTAHARSGWRIGLAAVAGLAALAAVVFWMSRAPRDGVASAANVTTSIAVLPFADLSPDRSSAYLGDGVAETLITALSKVPGLTVSARTSAFSVRDKQNDLQAIGKLLGVSAVLTGSIQHAGDQLRITARAVRIANDSILWSQSFDRPAADIFAVQDEVARAVVSAMRLTLSAVPDSSRNVGGTANVAAYEAYLLGRYYWNLRTTAGMIEATAAFKKAIAADSNYARAWSGLADTYVLSVPGEYSVPGVTSDSILPLAEAAARRAIALAPTLGEAYASLGETLEKRERDAEALAAFERAIALSPAYATGHQWYSYALMANRRFDDGVREMEAAHRLDPLAHVITLSLAIAYDGQDRPEDAAPLYAQGLAQQPQAWYAWRFRFSHELARGRFDEAAVVLRTALKDPATDKYAVLARLAPLWANPATREMATDSLIARGPAFAAVPLARFMRSDSVVVAVMERAARDPEQIEVRFAWGMYAYLGPRLRGDPRLQPVFRTLGYPEVAGASSTPPE